ncbi:MAG: RluA family pseudouridine synthase [Acidobacteria bacterium]|nr:MAG: RluA family pseudouridine synthase [Acidobacteriota bacterium]
MEIKSWSVPPDQETIRLDAFVRKRLPHLSRGQIEKAIQQKLLWINERVGKKGNTLRTGDSVTFRGPVGWLLETPLPDIRLRVPIIYEDASLVVLDKPAGMPTHGFSGRDADTLANFIVAQWPTVGNVGKSPWEPGLVHRLDRETSGLVLVAKNQSCFEDLRLQFRRRQVKKMYRALVWGITEAQGSISYPITHDSRDIGRMQATIDSARAKLPQRKWSALTRFLKISASEESSFLEIEMETGVTHQIRVHLAALGHPIVGDTLYGKAHAENFGLTRHFLHACGLEFFHPAKRTVVKVESELPTELLGVLKRMGLVF